MVLAAPISYAATLTWTGAGGDSNITTAANWSPAQAPVSGDTLLFAGAAGLSPNLVASFTANAVSFNAGAAAFTLGGTGVYEIKGGGITNNSANTQTINNGILLGGNQRWKATAGNLAIAGNVNTNGKSLTLSGVKNFNLSGSYSGTGNLTFEGTGILTLTGTSTYSGGAKLKTGTVVIGSDNAFGTGLLTLDGSSISSTLGPHTLTNSLKISRSTTFTTPDNLTFLGPVSLGRNVSLTTNSAGILTLNGTVSSGKRITKAGSGTLVLNGNNTYSGGFTLSGGTFIAGSNTAAGTGTLSLGNGIIQAGGADRTLANPVTLAGNTTFAGSNNLTFTGTTSLTGTRTLTVTNPVTTFSGVIKNGASTTGFAITKTGAGTLTLSGTSANTYTGSTLVNDGILALAKSPGVNAFASTIFTIGDNVGAPNSAVVRLDASNQIPNTVNVNLNADGQLNVQSFTDQVAALNTTGGTIIGSGRLDLGGNVTTTSTGTNTTTISSGLGLNAARTFLVNNNALANDVDLTITGPISNGTTASSVTKTGLGTMLLGGASTYTGGTFVNNGTLLLGSSSTGSITSGPLGTGTVNLGDTTGTNSASLLFSTASGNTVANPISIRAGTTGNTLTIGGLNTSGVNTFSGPITLANNLTLNQTAGGESDFSGIISGTGNTTKTGDGIVVLANVNTYVGSTTVSEGTLVEAVSNAIGSGALTVNGPTAVFDLGANHTDTVGTVILDNNGTITGTGTSALTSTANFDMRSGTVSTVLAGTVGLTKTTTSTLTLSSSNTYSGPTTISAGTIQLATNNAISPASAATIASGANLNLGGFNEVIGSIAGAGSVNLGSGTLTTGANNTSTTFSGIISGTGGLTKSGTGTFTLSGPNTYTGATAINSGTLTLGNAGVIADTSAVTVASGATMNLANFSETIGSLSGAGSITLGSGTLTAGANNTSTTFSGIISGTGGLTKSGTGNLILTGSETFSGPVTINNGTLTLSGPSGTAASASAFNLNSGSTLVLDNSSADNPNRISNSAPVTLAGGTLQFISDANGSTESAGTLSGLSGASTINIVHNGGAANSTSLTFSSLGTIAPGATINFTASGGTLGSDSTGPHVYITGQANGLLGGWATVGTDFAEYYVDGVRAYSAYYTGSLGVNLNDPAKIILLSSSSPSGAYTLTNAGTTTDGGLKLTDLALLDLNTSSTRTLNLASGGLIKDSGPDTTISGAGRLTAGGTSSGTLFTSVEAGRTLTISSSIINNAGTDGIYGNSGDGTVSLSKSDAGTLVLSGVNTYTGTTHINGGIVRINADSNLGDALSPVSFGGGTLQLTAGFTAPSTRTFSIAADKTGTIDVASAQTLTLGNSANTLTTGNTASTLFKNGNGTLVVQSANAAFDGAAQVNAGTLELRNAQALGDSTNPGTVVLNGGTLALRNDTSTNFANPVSLIADSTIAVDRLTGSSPPVTATLGTLTIGANTLTITSGSNSTLALGGISLTGNSTINTSTTNATTGAITGGFGFTKSGVGTLTLNGSGTYSGTTTINAGKLTLGVADGIAINSDVAVASGAIFNTNSLAASIGSLAGAGDVTLGTGILTTGNSNTSTTFSGAISGTGGLTKTGTGVFTISGANSYTGATAISAGTLQLGASQLINDNSSLSIASGATFNLNNFNETIGSLSGAGTLSLGSGTLTAGTDNSTTTFSGAINGTGGLTKTGTGILTLSGGSNHSGATAINGGILLVSNAAALGTTLGGTTVAAGAEVQIAPGLAVNAEPLFLNGAGVSGAGALHTLAGGAAWRGPITLASNATIGSDNGLLTLDGTINTSSNTLTLAGAGDILSTGTISGSGGIVKSGSGTLTLNAPNTFTGSALINAGILHLGDDAALAGASMSVIATGAAIEFIDPSGINIGNTPLTINGSGIGGAGVLHSTAGDNSWTGNVIMASNSTIATDAGTSLTLSGGISDSGGPKSLTKTGTGTLIFSGNSSYAGATLINAGTLQLAASDSMAEGSAVTVASGATLFLNDFSETIGSLSGAGTVDFGTDATASLTLGGDNSSTTFSGTLTNFGDLIKAGSGTLTLSGTNTLTGSMSIDSGTLSIQSDANLGDSTTSITINGGTLKSTGSFTSGRQISVEDPLSTLEVGDAQTLTLSTGITGAGSLTKTGTGILNLTGPGTYTGDTIVRTGTLSIGAGGALDSMEVSVDNGATLLVASGGQLSPASQLTTHGAVSFNAPAASIASLFGSGTGMVTLNGTNLTLGNGSFEGAVKNGSTSGGLTKTETGTLTLTGNNTFTGPTVVALGTLELGPGGTLGGTAVTVGSGATPTATAGNATLQINGNYTIGTSTSGSLTIKGGHGGATPVGQGTLSLQDGTINTLTLANSSAATNLTLGGSSGNPSILNFDLGNTSTDLIAVGRKIALNGGGAIINLNQLAGTSIAVGTYPLLTFTALGSIPAGTFSLAPGSTTFGGRSFSLTPVTGTSTHESLIVTSNITPATAYWTGSQDSVWNSFGASMVNTNFSTDSAGTINPNQIPGSITDVIFTANSASNLNTTLGQDFSIKSLTFTGTGTPASTGSVTIGGTSTLTLGTGGLNVQAGSAAHSISTDVVLGTAQIWSNNSSNLLSVSGDVSNASNLLTINGSGNMEISGSIGGGSGGLAKIGSGTLTLTRANSYTGGTTVGGGALLISNTSGSGTGTGPVTVNSSGSFGGNGMTTSLVNVNSGGNFSPGFGLGTITIGSLSLAPGAAASFELDSTAGISDLAIINGDFNIASLGSPMLNLTDLNPTSILSGTFTLATYTGSWNGGLFSYAGQLIPDGGSLTLGGNTYQLDYNSGGHSLVLTAIPEPQLSVLLLAACSLFVRRQRRRSQPAC